MVVVLIAGIAFLAIGIAHYAGFAKPLAHRGMFGPYLGLGAAWLGASGLLSAVGLLLSTAGYVLVGTVLILPAFPCFALGVLSIVWLPRRLRPQWMRRWIGRGRPVEEVRLWPRWGRGPVS